jgi:hypothetical protein
MGMDARYIKIGKASTKLKFKPLKGDQSVQNSDFVQDNIHCLNCKKFLGFVNKTREDNQVLYFNVGKFDYIFAYTNFN